MSKKTLSPSDKKLKTSIKKSLMLQLKPISCFACATHTLSGDMPLHVDIYDNKRKLCKTYKRVGG
jgi:hypothetical protein